MAARPLLLLGCVALGTGYVILPGSHNYPGEPPFGLYWGTAAFNNENTGLAAGLAFVYSPSLEAFCDALLVQMRENTHMIKWADCEQIQNAVMRAMQTWEANHQAIKFVDVTQACEREALTNPEILEDMRNCPHAELLVSAGPPETTVSTVAALVRQYNAEWNSPNQKGPLNTAGGRKNVDFGIERASMHFHNHFCWYLDNTFCGGLHETYASGFDVQVLLGVVGLGLWIIGFGVFLRQLVMVIRRIVKHHRDSACLSIAEDVLIQVSDALAHNKAMMLLLITCPVVWFDVVAPCFQCFDFEAAAAHELGHVLGFGHTDEFFVDNLRRPDGVVMNDSTCGDAALQMPAFGSHRANEVVGVSMLTTDHVEDCSAAYVSGTTQCIDDICCNQAAYDRVPLSSIMYSLTTHTARPCLGQDDLDGLNHLYPSCEYARLTEPLCIKSERNIGYIRFAINVLVPFTIIALTSQLLFTWSFRHHKRKELKARWKLAGAFVSVEDAAALCVQTNFRKHHAVIQRYKRDVSAIVLQSAFRGALSRWKLGKHADFGAVAMAVHHDIHMQRALHEQGKVDAAEAQFLELQANFAAAESTSFAPQ